MDNSQNSLIRAIIEQKIREELEAKQQVSRENPLDRINGISSKIGNFGEGLSTIGDFLGKFAPTSKVGAGMQTAGNAIQKGATAVQNTVPTSSALMNKVGSKVASSLPFLSGAGTAGAIGAGTAGTASGVGTGSAIGSAISSAAPVATTGMSTGIGAGAAGASAGASAGGAAAGGAAAGGSAAGGAAAAGPIGALIALGVMALQGTNRKRAKATGEQAQKLADAQVDISKNRAKQAGQTAQQLGDAYQMQVPSTLNTDVLALNDSGNISKLIDSYIQGSSDTSSLNSALGVNNIPQTPVINQSQPQIPTKVQQPVSDPNTQNSNQGIFNKLANGLGDFVEGYKDNRNNGFDANNLRPEDNKGAMERIGEGFGTAARAVQNPVVQGLVAGGLSTALTGNPLYGLGMGYKFYNQQNNSDMYKDILAQQGINTGNSNGVLTSGDLSKILTAKKYQKDFITRGDYDKLRLENGQLSVDEYNALLSTPDYKSDEMVNVNGVKNVARAGRYIQENKNDKSKNYYRSKNDGKNVIKVEYGQKPDLHNYTHVTYGAKPEQKTTTTVNYNNKPQKTNNSTQRIKVKSPDGKIGTIPVNQLKEAIKKGFKKV